MSCKDWSRKTGIYKDDSGLLMYDRTDSVTGQNSEFYAYHG